MGMLDLVHRGRKAVPRRTVMFGVHGWGKSTWASKWPNPIFVQTEDGVADLDVASFPLAKSLNDAWQAIMELGTPGADHGFKTVVLDTADWLEQLIWNQVCEQNGKKSITDFDFGKGHGAATTIFSHILTALNACRDAGMHVVILAHCEITKFTPPGQPSYDRYVPKLHRDAASLLQEWADELLFANYETSVIKEDLGFNKERGIVIGRGERVLYTSEGPGYNAKNRLGLPPKMSANFEEYAQYLNRSLAGATA